MAGFIFIYPDLLKISKIVLHINCRSNKNLLEFLLAGTGWDRMSADNVLLKTLKSIYAASDRCLAENLGCLLERSCRNEAVGLQRSSCDTLENLACCSRLSLAKNHHPETLTLK